MDWENSHHSIALVRIDWVEHAEGALGLISKLGERFGRSNTHRGRNARPLSRCGSKIQRRSCPILELQPVHVDKGLVDGMDLVVRAKPVAARVHAAAHVSIKCTFRAKAHHALSLAQIADLERRAPTYGTAHHLPAHAGQGRERDWHAHDRECEGHLAPHCLRPRLLTPKAE